MTRDPYSTWPVDNGVLATDIHTTRVGYSPDADRIVVELTTPAGNPRTYALTRQEAQAMAEDLVDVLEAAAWEVRAADA
jgi:hypothetical protein